ncbi:MAG: tetratricopeptide repeat protein [bacterium]
MNQPETTPKPFNILINRIGKLWSIWLVIAAVFARELIFRKPGFRLLSDIFILGLFIFIDIFLWRWNVLRSRTLKVIVISIVTFMSFVIVGWMALRDIQVLRGFRFQPGKPGESLVVVAEFSQKGTSFYDPTARIKNRLDDELKKYNIDNVRIETCAPIENGKEAQRIGEIHNALFVIWGWYDDIGFTPIFTIIEKGKEPFVKIDLYEIPLELREFNLYIREGLPKQITYLSAFTIGQTYFWQERYSEALHAFDVAIENFDQSSWINGIIDIKEKTNNEILLYSYRGYVQLFIENFNDAIDNFTHIIELDSMRVEAYSNRGAAHSLKDNFNEGIADFTKAIKLDSMVALYYYNRGVTYINTGNIDQGVADFTKAIELDSMDTDSYVNRGKVLCEKQEFDKGISDYMKAIKIDPTFAIAYHNLGAARFEMGNLDQAINDYTKAIKLDPTHAITYNNRGYTYEKKGDLDQAIADYTRAIELDSTLIHVYNFRGCVYIDRYDFDKAIADFTKAIEFDSSYANAFYNRGNAHMKKGNHEKAISDYTRAIELDSTDAQAYNNLGAARFEMGNLDQAIADYTRAIELDPIHPDAYRNRGIVHFDGGNYDQAIIDFETHLPFVHDDIERAKIERVIRDMKNEMYKQK